MTGRARHNHLLRPRNYRTVLFVLLSFALLANGCVTLGLQETARATPVGKVEHGGGVTSIIHSRGGAFLPLPFYAIRVGVVPGHQLGANLNVLGAGASCTWQFLSVPLDMALFARASGFYVPSSPEAGGPEGYWGWHGQSRVVVSNERPRSIPFSFNVGIDMVGRLGRKDEEGPSWLASWGLGVPIGLGPNRRLRLMPEVGMMHTLRHGPGWLDSYYVFGLSLLSVARMPDSELDWQ